MPAKHEPYRWYELGADVEIRKDRRLVVGKVTEIGRVLDTVTLPDGSKEMRHTFEIFAPEEVDR